MRTGATTGFQLLVQPSRSSDQQDDGQPAEVRTREPTQKARASAKGRRETGTCRDAGAPRGMHRSPPSSLVPSRPAPERTPASSGSPQGRTPASRPRGRTALCARRSGIDRSSSALSLRAAGSGTGSSHHPVQRGYPCEGRDAQGSGRVQEGVVDATSSQRRSPRHEVAKAERRTITSPAALVAEREVDDGGSSPAQRSRRGGRQLGTGERRAASDTPTVAIDRGRGAVRGSPSESSETRRHSESGHDP